MGTTIDRVLANHTVRTLPSISPTVLRDIVSKDRENTTTTERAALSLFSQQDELEQHGQTILELFAFDILSSNSWVSSEANSKTKEELLCDKNLAAISKRYRITAKVCGARTARAFDQAPDDLHVTLFQKDIGALYRSYKLEMDDGTGTAKPGEIIDRIGSWLIPLFKTIAEHLPATTDEEVYPDEENPAQTIIDAGVVSSTNLNDLTIAQHAHGATARLNEHVIGRHILRCPTYEFTQLGEQLFKVVCKVRDREGAIILSASGVGRSKKIGKMVAAWKICKQLKLL